MKTSHIIDDLVVAEASAWLVRLHQASSDGDKSAFREWLKADPAHAQAFSRVNDVWDLIPGAVAQAPVPRADVRRRSRPARVNRWLMAAGCAALLLMAVGIGYLSLDHDRQVYRTGIGQQKTIVLDDGTRITLNTDTRIAVQYTDDARHVVLEHGEALFHVTHNAQRPFVVETGNQRIVDLGTVFDVSHYSSDVVVTLLDGKVWVGALDDALDDVSLSTAMEPGERLRVHVDGKRVVDRPHLQDVTAWRHGRIYFDDISLAEAVAELNRYGDVPIVIPDPALKSLRISGVFSTHSPQKFASAVARLHGLQVQHKGRTVELTR